MTACPYKPRIRLNFGAAVRKTSQSFVIFFRTVRKAVAAGAGVFRTTARGAARWKIRMAT